MSTFNRLHNCRNSYQMEFKRVLCVCSAGLLRSPTTAYVLSQEPYNFNTRACGIEEDFALIPADEVLIQWAEEIVFMQQRHLDKALALFPEAMEGKRLVVLNIPDMYPYRDPILIEKIKKAYDESR